jgi:hypothetical protein
MAATKAKSTRGTKLQRGDGAGTETFTTIAEVKEATGPNETAAELEVTNFDSTAKEFVTDLSDGGEVSFDMNFIGSDAQQQGLLSDLRTGVSRNFKLIFNDHATTPTTAAFTGRVKSFEPKSPGGGVYSLSCSIKVSGQATWTNAPA